MTTAVLAVALTIAWVAACARDASVQPPAKDTTPRAVTGERGTLVLGRFGGIGGFSTVTTITSDGLVQWRGSNGAGLGQVSPQPVASVVGMATRDGFFEWKAVYAPAQLVADSLTTTLLIARADGRRHQVKHSSGAEAPELLTELFAQVSELDVQGRQKAFPTPTAEAIVAAKALFERVKGKYTPEQLEAGPCIAETLTPGWCVDIVHEPRVRVDNMPQNQSRNYRSGRTQHFVELTPQGDFIQAR